MSSLSFKGNPFKNILSKTCEMYMCVSEVVVAGIIYRPIRKLGRGGGGGGGEGGGGEFLAGTKGIVFFVVGGGGGGVF